jgi:MYXO-CTERM domain-containing protein
MHDDVATRRSWLRGSAGAALLVALTLLASAACDTLHPEELDCEEAVAYYQKCCPSGPSPAIECVESEGPFGGTSTPDISEFQSACLRAMSCDELVAGGYCAAASAFQTSADLFPPPLGCQTPPVCNGIPVPAKGVSGAATATLDGTPLGDLTQNGSLQASNGATASATLTFSNANYQLAIECQDILPTESMIAGSRSFAQMCMTTTLSLSESGVLQPLIFDLTSVPGNVRTTSALDSNGNGTVTVVVDIPPVSLPAIPAGSTLQLSISGLTVKQTFAAESCNSGYGYAGACAVATSADAPTTSPVLILGAVALALLLRRRRGLALAPAVLVWLWPRAAIAQEPPSQTVAPPPVAPEASASPAPAAAAAAPSSYRVAAVGTFFDVFDLHAWGAGAEASLVVARHQASEFHMDLRFIQELTLAGVFLEDVSARVTVEFLLGSSGLRAGLGGGAIYLLVRRATTASLIAVPGLDGYARFGYDAGLANRPFVMADFEIRAPLGAVAWGPTLQAGWRF